VGAEELDVWARANLELATAQRRAGLLDDARVTLAAVERRAADEGDIDLVARALLEAHRMDHGVEVIEQSEGASFAEKLDRAYDQLVQRAPDGDAVSARVLAASTRVRMHLVGGDREPAQASSQRAVEIARASGDAETLAFCLLARHD